MNNKTKNVKTIIPVITLALIASFSITGFESAHAVVGGTWASATQNYYCYSTLSNIDTTANVSECSDLSVAAGVWNQVSSSNWDFTNHASYSSGDVVIYPSGSSQYLAIVSPVPSGTITYANMWISTQYTYGNHALGDSGVYDYHTMAIHEFGHVAGLLHTSWPWSVMVDSQGTSDQRLSLDWTDVVDIQGMY